MAKKILVLVKDKLRPLRDLLRGLNPIRFTRFDKYFIKPIDKNYEIKSELKKQICIFISSRNNYVMLENEILLNFNLKGFTVINVDDGSHEEALNEGKKICKKNDIVFLENISNGLQYSLKTCLNYIKTNNLSHKYIWHITHDNYPVFNNFYDELYNILSKNINFGLLGFNCFDYRLCRDEIKNLKYNKFAVGLLGRAILASSPKFINSKWYNSKNSKLNNQELIPVECPTDTSFIININNFNKYVEVTNELRLHNWADDIALKFLKNNIYNYCAPILKTFNANEIKQKYKIPIWSTRDKTKKYHLGLEDGLKYWKKFWGWNRDEYPTTKLIEELYKNTLIEKFTKHNRDKGFVEYE